MLFSSLFHKKRNGKTLMLSKTHSLPFPFLFSLSKCCHPKRQPVVLSAVEGPALTAILTERSEWRDLLHRLTFHRKRNGKTLMLTKTHSLPFPFLFSLSKRWHHGCSSVVLSAAEGPVSFMSPRAVVERSVDSGRFLDSGPSDLRSE